MVLPKPSQKFLRLVWLMARPRAADILRFRKLMPKMSDPPIGWISLLHGAVVTIPSMQKLLISFLLHRLINTTASCTTHPVQILWPLSDPPFHLLAHTLLSTHTHLSLRATLARNSQIAGFVCEAKQLYLIPCSYHEVFLRGPRILAVFLRHKRSSGNDVLLWTSTA